MITDPASAIKREVLQLIDLQIETLKQESSLTLHKTTNIRLAPRESESSTKNWIESGRLNNCLGRSEMERLRVVLRAICCRLV